MALKAKQAGSIKKMKSSLKKGGGSSYIKRIPKDEGLTVRFLTEPDEWLEYTEHYTKDLKYFPCGDNCPGCASDDKEERRATKRYLARALDTDDNRVLAVAIPTTLARTLLTRYEKYNTLIDRDYELIRSGDGMDTTYDSLPESPRKLNFAKYADEEPVDLMAILEEQYNEAQAGGVDEDDEDDAPRRPRRDKSTSGKGKGKSSKYEEDDAPWDDDDDDDEEFVPRGRKKESTKKSPVKKSKPVSKPSKKPGFKKR